MTNPNLIDVSICIVSWNTCQLLRDCIESIYQNKDKFNLEIIVIDNASGDDSAAMTKNHFPGVAVIENTANLGYARAANQGIKLAKGRYILLLNTDTLILNYAIDHMCEFMDSRSDVAVCGFRHIKKDGTIQPSHGRFQCLKTEMQRVFNSHEKYSRQLIEFNTSKSTVAIETDSISGAGLMVRRSAIDPVGLLDENFYFYFEEADWCFRMKKSGWHVCWLPWITIIHYGGESTKQRPFTYELELYRGKARFFKKHYGVIKLFVLKITDFFDLTLKCAKAFLAYLYRLNDRSKRYEHLETARYFLKLINAVIFV